MDLISAIKNLTSSSFANIQILLIFKNEQLNEQNSKPKGFFLDSLISTKI